MKRWGQCITCETISLAFDLSIDLDTHRKRARIQNLTSASSLEEVIETLQVNLYLLQTVSGVSVEITGLSAGVAIAAAAKIIQTETPGDIGYTPSSFQDAMKCREKAR